MKASALPFLAHQLPSVYKIGKQISIYKKYAYNSGQNNFDLLANHIYAKIVLVTVIDIDFLER